MVNSYIALGYKCNHKCINCPLSTFDRLHGELDKEIIIKNIEKLSKYGDNLHITISGGEPTLNPNFLEVLKILGSANANISILSNATTCRDEEFVKQIINSLGENYNLNRFKYITAIHSYDKNIHDKLTGVVGSFDETIKGLENLNKFNIHTTIKIIMNKVTAKDMKKTLSYLCEHFKGNTDFEFCATDYAGRCSKNIDDLYISFVDLEPYIEECLDEFEKNNSDRKLRIIETPLCSIDPYYWKYFEINNGEGITYIAPNDESKDNKNDNFVSSCHTNYKECDTCDVRKYCSGIWDSTYRIERDKNNIIRPIKNIEGDN